MNRPRFVIASLARCGSTTLCNAINFVAPNACGLEPFNAVNYGAKYHRVAERDGLDRGLEVVFGDFTGFKHVWNPNGWPFAHGSPMNQALFATAGLRFVLLHRRNILKRVVSQEIASQNGAWRSDYAHTRSTQLCHRYSPLSAETIAWYVRHEQDLIHSVADVIRAQKSPLLKVAFEALYEIDGWTRRCAHFDRILDFVGIDRTQSPGANAWLRSLFQPPPARSEPVYRRVPGISELERRFGSDKTGHLPV